MVLAIPKGLAPDVMITSTMLASVLRNSDASIMSAPPLGLALVPVIGFPMPLASASGTS